VVAGWWRGTPDELLLSCQSIETRLGRTRPFVNAPRTIDIDLLFWEGRAVHSPQLSVPHPRLAERAFALFPLLELAPELTSPQGGRPLAADLTGALLTQGILAVPGDGDAEPTGV
jgi:2-amino-4-hydroxy-6-hydroxymethyldihydropteridine diphosphokinase